MNILITGGAGFIGQHIVRKALGMEHFVVVYDIFDNQAHKNINRDEYIGNRIITGDVRDRWRLKQTILNNEIDCIMHLASQIGAGQSMYEIGEYVDHNVNGTGVLLDILADRDSDVKHVILASSRAAYGEGPYICKECARLQYPRPRTSYQLSNERWNLFCELCGDVLVPVAMQEDDAGKAPPASIYGQTKLAQEHMLRIAANAYGFDYSILRLFNTYGPGQSINNPFTGIVSILLNWALTGHPMCLYEDGQMIKDFIFVEDVARAFLKAVNTPVHGAVNIGTNIPTTMFALAQLIKDITGSKSDIIIKPQYRVGDARHGYASTVKAVDYFKFVAETTLGNGLERLYGWAKTQPLMSIEEDYELADRGLAR